MNRLRLLVPFSLVVAILSSLSPALSQVNTESLRKQSEQGRIVPTLGALFEFRSGNTDFFTLGGNLRLDYRIDNFATFLFGRYKYGEQDEEIFTREGFAHLRGMYAFGNIATGEVFVQKGFDEFLRLRDRFLIGAGGRFMLISSSDSNRTIECALGVGAMHEMEEERGVGEVVRLFRSTNYLSTKIHTSTGIDFAATLYAQPALERFEDLRLLGEADFSFEVLDPLSFTTSVVWRYDSEPLPEVESNDLSISNGFRIDL